MTRMASVLLVLALLVVPFALAADEAKGPVVANFSLKDTAGKDVALADFKDKQAIAVVFLGTECPLVNLYLIPLKQLHEEFAKQGVQFLAVNSNSQDDAQAVAAHAKARELPFPVLKDADHRVADLFRAQRTPEVCLLNKDRAVVYRGRIDDQFGVGFQRAKPGRRDLAEALKETLAGQPVSVAKTEAAGCLIGRAKPSVAEGKVTYTKHVARILQQNCQECHRPGQIGPFSLMTYEKSKAWSDTVAEIVKDGRMPPWSADPKHGKFSNDRSISKTDRETLLAWVDQGCPKGDEKDMPPPRTFFSGDGWRIGRPDAIVKMPLEYKVPAQVPPGGVPYEHFVVLAPFEQDVWVQAAEAKPGNKAVVHHIIAFVVKPGESLREGRSEDGIGGRLLVATAPGDIPTIYKPGLAKKIPKGSKIVFQMHYTPNGEETTDCSSVGLVFAKEPPQHVVHTRSPWNRDLAIPPGEGNYKAECTTSFKKDAVLLNFMPHMHLRGKDFEYRAVFPDGTKEILLSVPRYDFGWQTYYQLAAPRKLPAGTKLECTAHFDNSPANPNNPDPTKTVRWGDQTWEEMMIGWMDYYYEDEKPS